MLFLLLGACVVALLGAGLQVAGGSLTDSTSSIHAVGSDDAFISYRYTRNLIEGHGLVFNPGDRVEGYTNLLYVLLSALPLIAFGPD